MMSNWMMDAEAFTEEYEELQELLREMAEEENEKG